MDVAGVMVAGGKGKLEQARGAGATNTPERRFNVIHPLVEVIARKINRSLNRDPVRNFVALPISALRQFRPVVSSLVCLSSSSLQDFCNVSRWTRWWKRRWPGWIWWWTGRFRGGQPSSNGSDFRRHPVLVQRRERVIPCMYPPMFNGMAALSCDTAIRTPTSLDRI